MQSKLLMIQKRIEAQTGCIKNILLTSMIIFDIRLVNYNGNKSIVKKVIGNSLKWVN